MLEGEAVVTWNDAEVHLLAGDAIDIPPATWHRVKNRGEGLLVFVEVQTGDYFGEDDITRAEDDYGRL